MKRIILYILLSLFITSCSKTIKIDIPDKGRRVVINGLLKANQTPTLEIRKSLYIQNSKNDYDVIKTPISLYVNNEFTENLKFNPETEQYYGNTILKENDNIKISLDNSTYKNITATNKIPKAVKIISYNIKPFKKVDFDGYTENTTRLTIKFKDPPNENNYYQISIIKESKTELDINGKIETFTYTNDLWFESYDPNLNGDVSIMEANSHSYFSDKFLDGKEYELVVFCHDLNEIFDKNNKGDKDNPEAPKDKVSTKFTLYLSSISKDYYKYLASYNAYIDAVDNPFAEPVQVHTNVNNGLGIVAGIASDSINIQAEK